MSASLEYVLIGRGAHSDVVEEIAIAGYRKPDWRVSDDEVKFGPFEFTVGIGSNDLRRRVFERFATDNFPRTIVHPFSWLSPTVKIGNGSVIAPGVVVTALANINVNCILNTSCSVDHHCVVGAHCHVGPGARLCGSVRLDAEVFVGAGAVILPNVTVGYGAVIGAGAVVTKDVQPGSTIVGVF